MIDFLGVWSTTNGWTGFGGFEGDFSSVNNPLKSLFGTTLTDFWVFKANVFSTSSFLHASCISDIIFEFILPFSCKSLVRFLKRIAS